MIDTFIVVYIDPFSHRIVYTIFVDEIIFLQYTVFTLTVLQLKLSNNVSQFSSWIIHYIHQLDGAAKFQINVRKLIFLQNADTGKNKNSIN